MTVKCSDWHFTAFNSFFSRATIPNWRRLYWISVQHHIPQDRHWLWCSTEKPTYVRFPFTEDQDFDSAWKYSYWTITERHGLQIPQSSQWSNIAMDRILWILFCAHIAFNTYSARYRTHSVGKKNKDIRAIIILHLMKQVSKLTRQLYKIRHYSHLPPDQNHPSSLDHLRQTLST